jgi:type III pantothenate kinase
MTMLLAIDVGNTHTIFGIYRNEKLLADWRVSSTMQQTDDEAGAHVKLLLGEAGFGPKDVTQVGISSVVPNLTEIFSSMARRWFGVEPIIIDSTLDLGIAIHYVNPKSVGADRLCNAVAGYAKYGGPLIIIDFGTATTYDIVASDGGYLGGVIAPGVETAAADLHRRAAKLPKIELRLPAEIIATDTEASMQVGVLYGAIDSMEGMIRRIRHALEKSEPKAARIIATGGFSRFISQHSTMIEASEPSLVLEGIRLICRRVVQS